MLHLRIGLLSLLIALGASAAVTASASALHWYVLSGGAETKLGEGAANALKIEATQTERYTLSAVLGGVLAEITCNKSSATGTIENPTGGGSGLGLLLTHLLECEVKRPLNSGCVIPNELIHASALLLLKTSSEGHTLVLFSPDPAKNGGTENKVLVSITFEKCFDEALDGTRTVQGMANAKLEGSHGDEVVFVAGAPNNELTFGGSEATFTGKSLLSMAGAPTVSIMAGA
jgi:hypothetical protein